MKAYKVTEEQLTEYKARLSKCMKYKMAYGEQDYETFGGIPVATDGDFEFIDNKPVIDFLNSFEEVKI